MDNITANIAKKHTVRINYNEDISLTAVKNVNSFDDKKVVAEIEGNTVVISGERLQIDKLDLDNGELRVTGLVRSLEYSKGKEKVGLMKRIFK